MKKMYFQLGAYRLCDSYDWLNSYSQFQMRTSSKFSQKPCFKRELVLCCWSTSVLMMVFLNESQMKWTYGNSSTGKESAPKWPLLKTISTFSFVVVYMYHPNKMEFTKSLNKNFNSSNAKLFIFPISSRRHIIDSKVFSDKE